MNNFEVEYKESGLLFALVPQADAGVGLMKHVPPVLPCSTSPPATEPQLTNIEIFSRKRCEPLDLHHKTQLIRTGVSEKKL